MKRKGFISFMLLWLLTGLLAVLAALVLFLSRSLMMEVATSQGLTAVYAAESGANWALQAVKEGKKEEKNIRIPLDGAEVEVSIEIIKEGDKEWTGVITSKGRESSSGYERLVKLSFTKENDAPEVRVREVRSDQWLQST